MKVYALQEQGERRLKSISSPWSPGTKEFDILSTALSVAEFGYCHQLARFVLKQAGVVENPNKEQIEEVAKKDILLKSFIAGNLRMLRTVEEISFNSITSNMYPVGNECSVDV